MQKQLGVLVVDRDADVREGLRDILAVEGYAAACASPGIAARIALATSGPCIVLLGHTATPRNGLEFVKMGEQESFLLDIAMKVITSTNTADAESDKLMDAKMMERAVEAARREAVEDMIADHRAYQRAVVRRARREEAPQLAATG